MTNYKQDKRTIMRNRGRNNENPRITWGTQGYKKEHL
jgi:hypothetical protein